METESSGMTVSYFRHPPILRTPRLELRQLALRDAPAAFAFRSDVEVTKWLTWGPDQRLEDTRSFLERVIAQREQGEPPGWGTVLQETEQLIGAIWLNHWDERLKVADVGYALNQDFWNRGYMSEALTAVVRAAFEDFDASRIDANVDVENTASARVLQKVGFDMEGTRSSLFVKGNQRDYQMCTLLRANWSRAA